MAIRFVCECGKKLKAPDEKIGKKVLCSTCGATLIVPESDTASVETVSLDEKTNVANLAGDLLKRSVAESKKRNAAPPEAYDDSAVDVGELVQFVVSRVLPGVAAVALLFFGTYWFANSAMTTSKIPPLGRVSGTVLLDGEPLARATVMFRPSEEQKGSASIGNTDNSGRFTLIYVRDVNGAVIGKHRVEISALNAKGAERIPARYNQASQLSEEVKAGGNKFEFKLDSSN